MQFITRNWMNSGALTCPLEAAYSGASAPEFHGIPLFF